MTSIKSTRICAVAGCESKHYSKGYCGKHYQRVRKTGNINTPISSMPIEDRFWSKVDRRGPDECWLWTGSFNSGGYGQFRLQGKTEKAHRISWELANGPIQEGEGHHGTCVCHACDNRKCVNPAHLFISGHAGNMADMVKKGRAAKGEDNGRSKLTAVGVQVMRHWYLSAHYTQQSLADVFGISRSNVGLIVNYKAWRHVV